MSDRHQSLLNRLVQAVVQTKGSLDSATRADLVDAKLTTGLLGAFAIKVAENPTAIGDSQIDDLLKRGHSEDAIFETIIAASVGFALVRLRRGLAVLEEAGPGS